MEKKNEIPEVVSPKEEAQLIDYIGRKKDSRERGKKWGYTGLAAVSLVLSLLLIVQVLLTAGVPASPSQRTPVDFAVMDRFDTHMTNAMSSALEGVLSIKKLYWLSDDDLVAPEPDPARYGETEDPASMADVLAAAEEILEGQDTLFTTETVIMPGSKVTYYLDETIFAVTWKQIIDNFVYTMSEVKIAHPSQFRRFLAGGEYGSDKQFITTEMAASVNAVVASSGDFYKHRRQGVIVNNGQVNRVNGEAVDTCMIDDQGELIFVKKGQLTDVASAQEFVDANNIRFSMAFGPILIENGQRCEPGYYTLGEIDDPFPRAAIGQRGKLHYVICTLNAEGGYTETANIHQFAQGVSTFGCDRVYTLDGGQTAVITMNDQMINRVLFGQQRRISDIFYFATAVPDGE